MNSKTKKMVEGYSKISMMFAEQLNIKEERIKDLENQIELWVENERKNKLDRKIKEERIKDEHNLRQENEKLTTKLNKMICLVSKFNRLIDNTEEENELIDEWKESIRETNRSR